MDREGWGLILGKFMPLHTGHQYLIEFAQSFARKLVIVVDCLNGQVIPVETRVEWIKELYPLATVIGLNKPMPQQPEEHPEFWQYWREILLNVAGEVDYLFTSEAYGEKLAKVLGVKHIPCDIKRQCVTISATDIRNNITEKWHYLSAPARRYYLRRIVLMGPESTGKTFLAEMLARNLKTTWVPEYAAHYLLSHTEPLAAEDLVLFLRGQLALQKASESHACGYLICDTDYLSTQVWAELLFNISLPKPSDARIPDLTLLLAPNVPWVKAYHRNVLDDPSSDEVRWDFFRRCREKLELEKRRYVIIDSPTHPERNAAALAAISEP